MELDSSCLVFKTNILFHALFCLGFNLDKLVHQESWIRMYRNTWRKGTEHWPGIIVLHPFFSSSSRGKEFIPSVTAQVCTTVSQLALIGCLLTKRPPAESFWLAQQMWRHVNHRGMMGSGTTPHALRARSCKCMQSFSVIKVVRYWLSSPHFCDHCPIIDCCIYCWQTVATHSYV